MEINSLDTVEAPDVTIFSKCIDSRTINTFEAIKHTLMGHYYILSIFWNTLGGWKMKAREEIWREFGANQIPSDEKCENPCWPPLGRGGSWEMPSLRVFQLQQSTETFAWRSDLRPDGTGHDVGGRLNKGVTRCVGFQLTWKKKSYCFKSQTLLSMMSWSPLRHIMVSSSPFYIRYVWLSILYLAHKLLLP